MGANQTKVISYPQDNVHTSLSTLSTDKTTELDCLDTLAKDQIQRERVQARLDFCLAEISMARTKNKW